MNALAGQRCSLPIPKSSGKEDEAGKRSIHFADRIVPFASERDVRRDLYPANAALLFSP